MEMINLNIFKYNHLHEPIIYYILILCAWLCVCKMSQNYLICASVQLPLQTENNVFPPLLFAEKLESSHLQFSQVIFKQSDFQYCAFLTFPLE